MAVDFSRIIKPFLLAKTNYLEEFEMSMKTKLILIFGVLMLLAVSAPAQKLTSIYTSLETRKCKTIESSSEGAGWYRGQCPGIGGYKLEVTEGDIRQSINVIAPNKKVFELSFGNISGSFSYTGAKAEWRMKGKTPVALIIRFNASEDPADSTKVTSYLTVSKITKGEICVTDVVKPSKNQNLEAQQLSNDATNKPCKSFD